MCVCERARKRVQAKIRKSNTGEKERMTRRTVTKSYRKEV